MFIKVAWRLKSHCPLNITRIIFVMIALNNRHHFKSILGIALAEFSHFLAKISGLFSGKAPWKTFN